jgi:hypothetical protein
VATLTGIVNNETVSDLAGSFLVFPEMGSMFRKIKIGLMCEK